MKAMGRWMICLVAMLLAGQAMGNDVVRMTWTVKAGSTSFYFKGTKNAQFTIDWGDGSGGETVTATGSKNSYSRTYSAAGSYNVVLKGVTSTARILSLDCSYRDLTALTLEGCTALTSLQCYNNQLTSLNVSGCTALTSLSCYNNQLASLEVGENTALTSLACANNQLTSFAESKNTALKKLYWSI